MTRARDINKEHGLGHVLGLTHDDSATHEFMHAVVPVTGTGSYVTPVAAQFVAPATKRTLAVAGARPLAATIAGLPIAAAALPAPATAVSSQATSFVAPPSTVALAKLVRDIALAERSIVVSLWAESPRTRARFRPTII